VPVTRRSAVVAAPPADVWRTVADPYMLPRWWPRVERVEGVGRGAFTQVLRSDRGATVRADFRIALARRPTELRWTQDLAGTPFAKLLRRAETRIVLAPEGDGATRVEIALDQKLAGTARLGGPLVRRATRRRLDEALAALAAVF